MEEIDQIIGDLQEIADSRGLKYSSEGLRRVYKNNYKEYYQGSCVEIDYVLERTNQVLEEMISFYIKQNNMELMK